MIRKSIDCEKTWLHLVIRIVFFLGFSLDAKRLRGGNSIMAASTKKKSANKMQEVEKKSSSRIFIFGFTFEVPNLILSTTFFLYQNLWSIKREKNM